MRHIPVQTYLLVFLITLFIIVSAFFASVYITRKKTDQIQTDESKMAIDIFALEAKIDLLKESDCSTLDISMLPTELSDLLSRIRFMENQVGENDSTIFRLKRYYALLEIKDYIINQKLTKRCLKDIPTIVYFYDKPETCSDCVQEEFVLDAIHALRPDVNIYYLDYNHDLQAFKAYTPVQSLPKSLPVLIINNRIYWGLMSLDEVQNALNQQDQSIATTTNKK